MYEARARAAAILCSISVVTATACLLTLLQVPAPPVALQVVLGGLIGLFIFMTASSVAAWYVNRKEGN